MKNVWFEVIDLFASEYGWSIKYVLSLDTETIAKLYTSIIERKQKELAIQTKLTGMAVAAAFSGKLEKLDNLFKNQQEEESPDSQIEAMRALWIKMNRDPKEFEKQLKEGKVHF